jgi:hypothetical protein
MMPIPVNDNDTQHQQKYASNFPLNDRRNRPPYPNQQPWTSQQDTTQHTPETLPPPSEVDRSDEPLKHLPRDMSWPPTEGARPPPQDPPSHRPPGPIISQHRHVPPSPPQYRYAPLPSQPDYRSPCLPPLAHHTTTHKFLAAPQEKGTLGDGVRIEAPFTYTYGYNIKTMDSVYIGKNSTIDDAGKVDIGPHTWIGSNVTILTTDVAKDV